MSDGIRSGVNWMRLNLQIDGLGELLDEQRLGEPGDAAQQAVAAGEKRNQNLADDALLADDGLGQLALEAAGDLGDALERKAPIPWRRSGAGCGRPSVAVYYTGSDRHGSGRAGMDRKRDPRPNGFDSSDHGE